MYHEIQPIFEKNMNKIGLIYDKIFLSDGWGNSK